MTPMSSSSPTSRKRVLYVEGNSDGTVGGSYHLMHDLIVGLDRSRYEPLAIFRFDNYVADRLRRAGVDVLILDAYKPLIFRKPWLNVALAPIKKLVNFVCGFVVPVFNHARFLRRQRIDLVNLNNSITRNHPWIVAARLTGTPCLTHEMGINLRYSLLSRVLGRRLDAIICLSHAIHDALKKGGADFPNTVVVHCGIDTRRYGLVETPEALRKKHSIPDGVPVIGVVGNVRVWKGQETIVRAFGLLRPRFPTLRCILVGAYTEDDMPYVERLKAIASQGGFERELIFAGFQQNAIDYMRLMDVVAHTSTHPEPFGIVTLEAMLAAKPLVSTTIGGPAEVVVSGETGLLVEPGKPELLAAAIGSLLEDPARAAEMARRGRDRLDSHFSLATNLSRTMEVYERILARTTA